jgi:Cytochrome P450
MDERDIRSATVVRLRDLMMPIWADVYYEVVFGKPCTPAARELIVDNASDVVTALKCCSLRHLGRRHRLTRFLIEKVRGGEGPHALPACLSTEEKALYLQDVFFNTAVVQMSEAMTHLMLVIAQHDDVQARLAADPKDDDYIHGVINEGLRIFPLFGISHRIASGDIAVNEQTTIPRGSVLCFNHQEFHRQSFDDPERFDPDRWTSLSVHDANFIPFGVAANRACPAQGMALITMRVAARELLRRVRFRSSILHTRSIPNRGPCLAIPRALDYDARLESAQLFWMRLRDRWEDVGRSIVQLVLGTYMVWDARRLRLCQRYFETKDSEGDQNPDPKHHASACPFAPNSTARTIPQPSGTRL